ncbi:MAG: hypothetical protein V2A58_04345 [Planctomycetota bacterium]
MIRWPLAAASVCLFLAASAAAQEPKGLVIECGQNCPNSAYWRLYARELEALLPFDGVMLHIEYPVTAGGTLAAAHDKRVGWMVFKRVKITDEMVAPFVQDMQAAKLTKLTHNFVNVCPYPYPHIMNWFDDAWWDDIIANIRIVARAAKDSGCVGLVFDPEQYGPITRLWNWRSLIASTDQKQSYEEYDAKVRERARAFGRALSEGFPDCTLLFFHGYSLIPTRAKEFLQDGRGKRFEDSDYALFAPWLDGMLEGTSDGTIFVDGYESSYGYREAADFQEGRWNVHYAPLAVTKVPDLFREKTRCGFGLWMDYTRDDYLWHPDNPDLNYRSPGRLQHGIYLALSHSDGYVWLWSEKANWYLDGPDAQPHPPASQQQKARGVDRRYRPAVADAKSWPGIDTSKLARPESLDPKTLGFIDRDDLIKLQYRAKPVMDLPIEGWLFKPDREDVGVAEEWFKLATDTADWKPIKIGEFWERQGFDLDGPGWYRREIDFTNAPAGKRLYLHFGAVDESLHLWIDGRYVATYNRGMEGWDKPFAIEVTDFLSPGPHTLIIRARDVLAMGGLWKPIDLLAE